MTAAVPAPGTPEFEAALEWDTGEDERHHVRTADGWNVSLFRYRAARATLRTPVVMGHGFAGSRYIFDCAESTSLARRLAADGFDVWCVDWRGRGSSWPSGGADETLQWCFDDIVFRDAPAVVAYIRSQTGAAAVSWIGTEQSGIAAYAIAISGTAPLARAVTLGAPMRTPAHAEVPGVTTPLPERDGTRYRFSMVRDIGPVLAAQGSELLESSFRAENTDWYVTGRYFRHGVPDEASAAVDQFKDWIEHDTMRDRRGDVVWCDRVQEITIPMLLMVGACDRQRPVTAVRATFDALTMDDATLVIAGTAEGFRSDYGHDDLIAGRHAPDDVHPIISSWLQERS